MYIVPEYYKLSSDSMAYMLLLGDTFAGGDTALVRDLRIIM